MASINLKSYIEKFMKSDVKTIKSNSKEMSKISAEKRMHL